MGLLSRIFGRGIKKLPYPPALQTQIENAMHHLQALTTGHDGAWRIGESQWNVDQDKGTIIFTTPRGMKATAPVQIIGTYNTEDSTWLGDGTTLQSCPRWPNMQRKSWPMVRRKATMFSQRENYAALSSKVGSSPRSRVSCVMLKVGIAVQWATRAFS